MQLLELMTKRVQTVPPSMAASDAWTLMRQKRIHHLAVLDGSMLVGVISGHDLGSENAGVREGRTVAELMHRAVVTLPPTASTQKAANVMRGRTIGSVIVVEEGRVVGIVTVSDLLEAVGRGGERGVERGKRWTLKHRVPHRPRRTATGTW